MPPNYKQEQDVTLTITERDIYNLPKPAFDILRLFIGQRNPDGTVTYTMPEYKAKELIELQNR